MKGWRCIEGDRPGYLRRAEVLHFADVPCRCCVRAIRWCGAGCLRQPGGWAEGIYGGRPATPVAQSPMIVGWDAAGVVEQGGSGGDALARRRVIFAGDITRAGCYAEYVAAVDAASSGTSGVARSRPRLPSHPRR